MQRFHPLILLCGAAVVAASCSDRVEPHRGDPSKRGGSATVREPYDQPEDDPLTSNDESNDQPVGHFGTLTLEVTSESSGNSYDLDAELDGNTVERVYFPKGGWVDFYGCELDEDFSGYCYDEEGRTWYFEGKSGLTPSVFVDEENKDSADDDSSRDEDDNEDEEPEN